MAFASERLISQLLADKKKRSDGQPWDVDNVKRHFLNQITNGFYIDVHRNCYLNVKECKANRALQKRCATLYKIPSASSLRSRRRSRHIKMKQCPINSTPYPSMIDHVIDSYDEKDEKEIANSTYSTPITDLKKPLTNEEITPKLIQVTADCDNNMPNTFSAEKSTKPTTAVKQKPTKTPFALQDLFKILVEGSVDQTTLKEVEVFKQCIEILPTAENEKGSLLIEFPPTVKYKCKLDLSTYKNLAEVTLAPELEQELSNFNRTSTDISNSSTQNPLQQNPTAVHLGSQNGAARPEIIIHENASSINATLKYDKLAAPCILLPASLYPLDFGQSFNQAYWTKNSEGGYQPPVPVRITSNDGVYDRTHFFNMPNTCSCKKERQENPIATQAAPKKRTRKPKSTNKTQDSESNDKKTVLAKESRQISKAKVAKPLRVPTIIKCRVSKEKHLEPKMMPKEDILPNDPSYSAALDMPLLNEDVNRGPNSVYFQQQTQPISGVFPVQSSIENMSTLGQLDLKAINCSSGNLNIATAVISNLNLPGKIDGPSNGLLERFYLGEVGEAQGDYSNEFIFENELNSTSFLNINNFDCIQSFDANQLQYSNETSAIIETTVLPKSTIKLDAKNKNKQPIDDEDDLRKRKEICLNTNTPLKQPAEKVKAPLHQQKNSQITKNKKKRRASPVFSSTSVKYQNLCMPLSTNESKAPGQHLSLETPMCVQLPKMTFDNINDNKNNNGNIEKNIIKITDNQLISMPLCDPFTYQNKFQQYSTMENDGFINNNGIVILSQQDGITPKLQTPVAESFNQSWSRSEPNHIQSTATDERNDEGTGSTDRLSVFKTTNILAASSGSNNGQHQQSLALEPSTSYSMISPIKNLPSILNKSSHVSPTIEASANNLLGGNNDISCNFTQNRNIEIIKSPGTADEKVIKGLNDDNTDDKNELKASTISHNLAFNEIPRLSMDVKQDIVEQQLNNENTFLLSSTNAEDDAKTVQIKPYIQPNGGQTKATTLTTLIATQNGFGQNLEIKSVRAFELFLQKKAMRDKLKKTLLKQQRQKQQICNKRVRRYSLDSSDVAKPMTGNETAAFQSRFSVNKCLQLETSHSNIKNSNNNFKDRDPRKYQILHKQPQQAEPLPSLSTTTLLNTDDNLLKSSTTAAAVSRSTLEPQQLMCGKASVNIKQQEEIAASTTLPLTASNTTATTIENQTKTDATPQLSINYCKEFFNIQCLRCQTLFDVESPCKNCCMRHSQAVLRDAREVEKALRTVTDEQVMHLYAFVRKRRKLFRMYHEKFNAHFCEKKSLKQLICLLRDGQHYECFEPDDFLLFYKNFQRCGLTPPQSCQLFLKEYKERNKITIHKLMDMILVNDWTLFVDSVKDICIHSEAILNASILDRMAIALMQRFNLQLAAIFFSCLLKADLADMKTILRNPTINKVLDRMYDELLDIEKQR